MMSSNTMKSKQKLIAPRADADEDADATATNTDSQKKGSTRSKKKKRMLLCRACLVLLRPQDASYDLFSVKDLAAKFAACTNGKANLLDIQAYKDTNEDEDVVLQCICECCYQLVQKFHDFQCMCEESLRNFQNLLQEVKENNSKQTLWQQEEENESENKKDMQIIRDELVLPKPKKIELIEDIEEVYIIEDETTNDCLNKERIPRKGSNTIKQRKKGLRYTLDCHICGRGFYKTLLLEAHIKQHEGEHPYPCVHCGKHFARSNLLDTHLRDVHQNPNERITYPCPKCNKVYSAERSLIYHFRRQHESKEQDDTEASSHVCDKCGKSYGRRSHLTRHEWVHRKLEERRYCCTNCDQRFYTKQNMKDHMLRRHSKRNFFKCKKCGRLVGSRLDLNVHMKRHL